jgi:hydrogenase-4 component B
MRSFSDTLAFLGERLLALTVAAWAAVFALASAGASLGLDTRPRLFKPLSFVLLWISGACAIIAAGWALGTATATTGVLPIGLPWMPWHLRLDPLAGFFFGVIGLVTLAVALYGPGHLREYERGKQPLWMLGLFTGLFVAGMQLVVLADDAFAFMVSWELMSLGSYFLVAYQHQHAANRRAAYLYLLMAQVGGLAILLGFGVLAGFAGDFTFNAMRAADLSKGWETAAFLLALVGFGMKAGLVPLHAWLPEAHPVAPSHISALMSGVMLKVAVYGFIRFTFDLIGEVQWGWGLGVLLVGSASALLGVLYALMQHDLKRLLAYHSVENIGIVFIGLGLAMIFFGTGHPRLGILGFLAALYHTLNHALFKSLLFMGAGTIIQHSHQRDLEHMGGLIHRMPLTSVFFLVGCVSISALPPFNGFVSEWLTFQAALQSPALESGVLRAMIPVTAAMLALTGALAAACFVKVYGVAFLGQPRSRHVRRAREAHWGMHAAQAWLAALCVVFGVLPTYAIELMDAVPRTLLGQGLPSAWASGWLWLTPVSPDVASYGAPLVLVGLLLSAGIAYWVLHRPGQAATERRSRPWDCGFGPLSPRMQYTSTAFSMPIRRIFQPVWEVHETVDETRDPVQPLRVTAIRHALRVEDRSWSVVYEPIGRAVLSAARYVGRIQTGSLRTYLAYSFFTLVVLLWLIS